MIRGRAYVFGDNIDTDQIYPGRYLELTDHSEIARHAMEGVAPDFVSKINKNDIIVGGRNFGCGSSREHAVICLKNAGVGAVIARSFARIFYRNALNMGLPVIELPEHEIIDGDLLMIDLEKAVIRTETGINYYFKPLPDNILKIIKAGGVLNYYRKQNEQNSN